LLPVQQRSLQTGRGLATGTPASAILGEMFSQYLEYNNVYNSYRNKKLLATADM
jgi:hypothetical protein